MNMFMVRDAILAGTTSGEGWYAVKEMEDFDTDDIPVGEGRWVDCGDGSVYCVRRFDSESRWDSRLPLGARFDLFDAAIYRVVLT